MSLGEGFSSCAALSCQMKQMRTMLLLDPSINEFLSSKVCFFLGSYTLIFHLTTGSK